MNTGTTQMMKQLFYISSANGTLLPEVVEEILKVSRRNNRAKGVSGFLLFDGRRFLQLLEGPAKAVDMTMAKIVEDKRHFGTAIIMESQISRAEFPDWAMAFEREGPVHDSLIAQVERRVGTSSSPAAMKFRAYAGQVPHRVSA